MKKIKIYRKNILLSMLNNLVDSGSFIQIKKILFLKYDQTKFLFWLYTKHIKKEDIKIDTVKTKVK